MSKTLSLKTPLKPKAIFFDADDTLFTVRGSVGSRYAPHLQAFGIDVSPQEIDKVIPKAWQALSESYENKENSYVTNHERDQKIWKEYVDYVLESFIDGSIPTELFTSIYEDFGKGESRALTPHVKNFIQHLNDQDILTGVLTNNDKRIHTLIPELGLGEHFSHIYCASDIGYKKPAPEVFHAIQETITIAPEDILYVGDCLTNDVGGAEKVGWKSLWYNPMRQKNTQKTLEINSFQQAIELF